MNEQLLTTEQVAKLIGVRPQTLAVWRSTKKFGLPYIKIGHAVRYHETAVRRWLQDRTVKP